MQDYDWFKAIFWAALGVLFGPFLFVGLCMLSSLLRWPSGEGSIAATMNFYFCLPCAFLGGLVAGPILGFVWGLAGERIKDLLYDATAWFFRLFRKVE
jgi:hypothetical protein